MRILGALSAASSRLGAASREGLADARRAWSRRATLWLLGYVAVAVAGPLVLRGSLLSDAAAGLYVALAAVGLNYAVGLGGMASLGQGAFVGVGAFAVALLTSRAGWAPGPATLAGAAAGLAAGLIAGVGAVRLRGPFVAVATWILSWLVAFGLAAFPSAFGGAQGVRVGRPPGPGGALPGGELTPGGHFEAALALLALAALVYAVVRRGPAGRSLSAARQSPAAAAALGIRPERPQLGAFAASAGIGGLAGGLAVQLAGVADPGAYGPLLSVELFVAVLIGGRLALGPAAGAAVLAAIPPVAGFLGRLTGADSDRLEGVVAAALLAVAVLAGRSETTAAFGRIRRRAPAVVAPVARPDRPRTAPGPRPGGDGEPILRARGLVKRFGGVVAADAVDLDVRPGEIHALIGPNGSGKTTALRLLAGALPTEAGSIHLGETDVTAAGVPARVRLGIVRTLQRTAVFPELTVGEHVATGAAALGRTGAFRALVATPQSRREAAELRARVGVILDRVGLGGSAEVPVGVLPGATQRLISIATALAANPRVLLLDEPAAGMDAASRGGLRDLLLDLRGAGTAVVLVEHDLRLVRAVADRVTVLDAGAVIAHGTPAAIARDPQVQRAYLGPPRRPARKPRPENLSAGGSRTHNPS